MMATRAFGQNFEKMRAVLEEQAASHSYGRRHVVLETPDFHFDTGIQEQCSRAMPCVNYIRGNSFEVVPAFPSNSEVTIPSGVIHCGLSLIACTILRDDWDPVVLLHFLFRNNYIAVQFDPSYDDPAPFPDLEVRNIRVIPRSTLTSSGPRSRIIQVQYPVQNYVDRRAVSNASSLRSFYTARSRMSVSSSRSSHSNSAFFSVSDHDPSTMIGTIREDETPSSELSAPLAQLHNDYYKTLHQQAIIQPFDKELNWSEKGQHVTFAPEDEVPLRYISHLGSSNTATVDKVICRRIALARKTMRCNRRWTVADASGEVYHLQNLRHFHIIQLVGTYLQGRDFSILMYPVADSHLGTFIEETLDMSPSKGPAIRARKHFLTSVLPCLTSALAFVHNNTTKHMDIKPQNILIRNVNTSYEQNNWRVYLADFGLSRSFASQDHSQTDGPTSRTPRFCSPEVYNDEPRGRPADIFSLGCVFLEIICVIAGTDPQDFGIIRRGAGSDESFHANIDRVMAWAHEFLYEMISFRLSRGPSDDLHLRALIELLISMVRQDPAERPTVTEVHDSLVSFPRLLIPLNSCCSLPPEPYECWDSS